MYKIFLNQVENTYEMREMVRMFLPFSAFTIMDDLKSIEGNEETDQIVRIPEGIYDKNTGKRYLYDILSECTGTEPDWGILTGVRPVKLTGELIAAGNSPDKAKDILIRDYYLKESKAELLIKTWKVQQSAKKQKDPNAISLYIGIPFCPSRCIYCSFPSYQAPSSKISGYIDALYKEIDSVGDLIKETNWFPESIYVGGGTPTTLSSYQLKKLLEFVRSRFDMTRVIEFTVEAGRPDTIDLEKLETIKSQGADRISINPQSMKTETLSSIGRFHSPEQITEAFYMAKEVGISVVNMDLIAGLPGESTEDFINSLNDIIKLGPENITVHTLSVKRASRLKTIDEEYSYRQGEVVGAMLNKGQAVLYEAGYQPYYLYRQKQMTGNFENVGYCLPGTESVYNIKIMEENQTVLALGAGGISKVLYPDENRIERIPNVSNYEIYIERIDEMIKRKHDHIINK